MFRSRKIRRQDRSHRAHSLPLGVELMEGRMMLSATGVDLQSLGLAAPSPSLDVTQFTFTAAQISLTGVHASLTNQSTDGGYVNDAATPRVILSYGVPSTPIGVTVQFNSVNAND